MAEVPGKIAALRARLAEGTRKGGALLVVYPPEEELEFRARYREVIRELHASGVETRVLDFRVLVFEVLQQRGLLEKAFRLDATESRDFRQSLAGMVQREAAERLLAAAQESPQAVLLCAHPGALYPWISFSELLERVEHGVPNTLVLPFPGHETGAALHFMGVKDGYNYRAARL